MFVDGLILLQITRIQSVHDKSLVHRSIKPDDFLVGVPGTKTASVIHIIGTSFSLSRTC